MESLEDRVSKIEERNKRVEFDKKWESSFARVFLISFITYIFASIAFYILGNPKPFVNAGIPVLGFILSTLSIPIIKKIWISKQ